MNPILVPPPLTPSFIESYTLTNIYIGYSLLFDDILIFPPYIDANKLTEVKFVELP